MHSDRFLKEGRRVAVIRIEQADEVAARGVHSRVEGGDLPTVLLKDEEPDFVGADLIDDRLDGGTAWLMLSFADNST